MSEKVISDFIDYFNNLKNDFKTGKIDEKELFELNHKFHRETGGRLSHYHTPVVAAVCIVEVMKKVNGINVVTGLLGVKK